MRRLHYGDISAAARAIMTVARDQRAPLCLRMIRQAQCADAHRRDTGSAHPLWGSGALMEVARCYKLAPDPGFQNLEYCEAFRLVLDCVRQAAISQRRS